MKDYLSLNKQAWNQRTSVHVDSEFYDNKAFLAGKSSLNEIELSLLGEVDGLDILHLMCHFGQDTISLARMGADVVGVDLSDKAIFQAQLLAEKLNAKASFINCDLYSLPQFLDKSFDIVFSTYGTIGWLPDIDKWAAIVSKYLKPGGRFVFVEFHPVVWMFDNDFDKITYDYFNSEPIVELENGTYADTKADIMTESVSWNHGLAEVMSALLNHNMVIDEFQEFDYSPYNCLAGMEEFLPGRFRIKKIEKRIPIVYSIRAIKSK